MGKMKLALLFGGASKDYSASLQSAYSVLTALSENSKYDIIPIGITKVGRWLFFPGNYEELADGTWEANSDCCSAVISPDPIHKGIIKILDDGQFSLQRIDAIFSVVHGRYGECGRIQSLCKLSGIPFVGSGPEAAVVCTDRMLTHLTLNRIGIKTTKYYALERAQMDILDYHINAIEEDLIYPLYVKAACCSRSIGVNRVTNGEELRSAVKIAFSHHHKIIAEEEIQGRELECIVYGNDYDLKISEVGEIVRDNENKRDKSKFILNGIKLIKADITDELHEKLSKEAKLAFKAFGCKGFARINFKLCGGALYCGGICNVPGFSETGILALLMEMSGFTFAETLDMIIGI